MAGSSHPEAPAHLELLHLRLRGGISLPLLGPLAFAAVEDHTGTGLNPNSHSQLTQGCCYQGRLVSSHHALPSLGSGHWRGFRTVRSSGRPFSAFQRNQSSRYTEQAGRCQPPPPTYLLEKRSIAISITTVLAFPTSRVRGPSPQPGVQFPPLLLLQPSTRTTRISLAWGG